MKTYIVTLTFTHFTGITEVCSGFHNAHDKDHAIGISYSQWKDVMKRKFPELQLTLSASDAYVITKENVI